MNASEHWLSFQKRGSEDSFRELVKHYAGLVFSVAQRRLLNPALAEEVCQVVFSRFARCGGRFSTDAEIAAWLHRTTVHVAIDMVRSEVRRKNREQIASTMHTISEHNTDWQEISLVLDEALNELSDADRKPLLLRFYEEKTMRELGGVMGITEEAAKMRVSRALERLRSRLVRCGVTASLVGLAGLMTDSCMAAAPGNVLSNLLARPVPAPTAPVSAINASKIILAVGAAAVMVLLLGVAKMDSDSGTIGFENKDAPTGQVVRARRPVRAALTEPTTSPESPVPQRSLHFIVIDAFSESPIPGVKVETGKLSFLTDQAGECIIPIPVYGAGDFYFRLEISKDGYVARYVSWSAFQRDTPAEIPERYTTRMEPATQIGGTVENEEGGGIAGVRIVLNGPSPAGVSDRDRTTVMGDFHTEITDEEGKWFCSHSPDPITDLSFELRHPEYVNITYAVEGASGWPSEAIKLPLDDLLGQRAVYAMKRGAKLNGTVVDAAGNPVSNTRITVNRQWREPTATVTNAVDGRFLIPNLTGISLLTVQAAGFAPRTLEIDPIATPDLSITLFPGKTLRGRVVDAVGVPIVNATVELDRIKFRPEVYKWSGKTDAKGEFTWNSAPDDAHPYVISAEGYHWKQVESWIADGEPKLVTLEKYHRPQRVFARGTVLNAASGQPVPSFTLTINEVVPSGGISPIRREFKNGEFLLEVDRASAKGYSLRVSADGYADWTSKEFPMPESDQHFNVQLKPVGGIKNP